MKLTVKTRNQVRTTVEQDDVQEQVHYVTARGSYTDVTMRDGRRLQLDAPVPGIDVVLKDTTARKTKSFLEKLAAN